METALPWRVCLGVCHRPCPPSVSGVRTSCALSARTLPRPVPRPGSGRPPSASAQAGGRGRKSGPAPRRHPFPPAWPWGRLMARELWLVFWALQAAGRTRRVLGTDVAARGSREQDPGLPVRGRPGPSGWRPRGEDLPSARSSSSKKLAGTSKADLWGGGAAA